MRRTRRLLLLAMVVIVTAVGTSFYNQSKHLRESESPAPAPLANSLVGQQMDWVYTQSDGDRPVVQIRAREMAEVDQPSPKLLLKKVEMRLYHKDARQFDLVRSESAEFDKNAGSLLSDGDVTITLAMPAEDEPEGRLVTIHSSGVKIDAKTGRAATHRRTTVTFDLGAGSATGAVYDPQTRQLDLHSDVVLEWRGRSKNTKPMRVEAGRLTYREHESKVYLSPWAKLEREALAMTAGDTVVTLEEGQIRLVEARDGKGVDKYPNRSLAFAAKDLRMELNGESQMEKITGSGEARLEAVSESARTEVRTGRIDLAFVVQDKESLLDSALATGQSRIESRPAPKAGRPAAATRVLRSDVILIKMRPGGEEMEAMETRSPGVLDLVPNAPHQARRHMEGERLWLRYAAKNQLESARAVNASTETHKPPPPRRGEGPVEPPPAITTSHDLLAHFNPVNSELVRLDQWNDFHYDEGDQHASAERASLDSATNLMTLERRDKALPQVRVWDPTGSVTADGVVLNQTTGEFTAQGQVASSRLPDKKATAGSAMLSQDEPVQAKADRMVSTDRNQRVVYEGHALMWQTGNRLQADRVLINRKDRLVIAEGNVASQFLDKKIDAKTKRQPVTLVTAPWMQYSDVDRLAHYKGTARMVRDGMDVKSRELRAWLREEKPKDAKPQTESSLDKAFADGSVEIFQTDGARTRVGSSEHAEYYTADERVILNGGHPQVVDSVKGTSRGQQLTYWSKNDSLQVEGAETQPVESRIRRK